MSKLIVIHIYLFCVLSNAFGQVNQESQIREKFLFSAGIGTGINFSQTSLIEDSQDSNLKIRSKNYFSLAYSLGVIYKNKNNFIYSLSLKSISIGSKVFLNCLTDSLALDFTVFSTTSKRNYIANLSFGYEFTHKRFNIRPTCGADYILNPLLKSSSVGEIGDPTNNVYILIMTQDKNINEHVLMPNLSCSIDYKLFRLKKVDINLSLNINFSYGISDLYLMDKVFLNGSKRYNTITYNKGSYLFNAIQLVTHFK